ncbi:hypothetical protein N7495_000163 [Penicillium taxi]|uniref:uncharacterized protein n=1 Tax=Penicillium taxi TaxID=168475 RepID=UPI0025455354|nr:uncharacterized protein N7495_000163 [Penicillium taxi]KAJ5907481.1 hypothetical protein N7495_000163 [Penicillium taxi]
MFGGDPDDGISIPVPEISDGKVLGVRRGYLHITGDELRDISRPVLQEVRDLIKQPIKVSKATAKAVFLVEGFA